MKKFIKKIICPHTYSSEAFIAYLRSRGVKIGKDVRFYNPQSNVVDDANGIFIEIGDNVQITNGVKILGHDYSFSVIANAFNDFSRKQLVTKIGNNVFIGQNVLILMGADIGDNVIIGAGAVVAGKVESNSVYAGAPAKKICTLEQLRDKNRASFVDSAKTYAAQFKKRNGRYPVPEEMKIYRALFVDNDALKEYVKNENYGFTITDKAKENIDMKLERKYSSVEEMMSE